MDRKEDAGGGAIKITCKLELAILDSSGVERHHAEKSLHLTKQDGVTFFHTGSRTSDVVAIGCIHSQA